MKEILLKDGHLDIDLLTNHYEVYNLNGDFIEEGAKDKNMSDDELLEYLGKERL